MSQPVWITPAGTLGTYSTGIPISIPLLADPVLPASRIDFKLLSGSLPNGTKQNPFAINKFGLLTGVAVNLSDEQKYDFTVRITDDLNNIRDRTFSLSISGATNIPKLTTASGIILHINDSEYISYQLGYYNPAIDNAISIKVTSGDFPPGLYLTEDGMIKGYPNKPKLSDGSPTKITYTFSVKLTSALGNDSVIYSIEVKNQELIELLINGSKYTTLGPANCRIPIIANRKPLIEPIQISDPYYDYYLTNGKTIPTIIAGEYFSFKVIGKDFDDSQFIYQFGDLPEGLVGDSSTGWITGVPILERAGVFLYHVTVNVTKKDRTELVSPVEVFEIYVRSAEVLEDIVWQTNSNLGTILNGTISMLQVSATATEKLNYEIISGSLPKNLVLMSNGEITGRVAEQVNPNKLLVEGDNLTFTFTIRAFSLRYTLLSTAKTFTITVSQYYPNPVENIYFKALPNLKGKKVIQSLLTDTKLIPDEYLFRPDDMYFGKAKDVSFVHVYGMEASTTETYINAIQTNHYERKILLGPIETAVATDIHGNLLYEVVYSKIIDDLESEDGRKLPDTILWDRYINLRIGPWTVNNTEINSSISNLSVNKSPQYIRQLHPAGLQNMRSTLTSNLVQNFDSRLLPKWMTTQQTNSNTLGFVQAWVICYTLPGKAQTVKDLINNNWAHKLNEIDFTIDRFMVDKSATFNWNTKLSVPTWNELPSATPVPDPLDSNDVVVLFPRKTILPRD